MSRGAPLPRDGPIVMRRTAASIQPRNDLQRALAACRFSLIMTFGFSVTYNLLLFAPSIYLLQIYDRVLSSRSLDTLLMLTLIVSIAVLVGGLLDGVRRAALSRLGGWLEDHLRPSVLAAALDYTLRVNGGAAVEACRDLTSLRQFIASPAIPLLLDAPWSILFLGVLFCVHPLLGGIAAASALIIVLCSLLSEMLTEAPLARAQIAEARNQQRFGIALRNIQVIRAMGMLDGAARLIYRDLAAAKEGRESATRRSEAVQAIAKPVRSLTQVVIMGAAAWLVVEHHLSAGVIFVTSLMLGRGLSALEGAIVGWKALGAARLSYSRLSEVLAATASPYKMPLRLPRPAGRLAIDNVSYVIPGSGKLVLQGVSLCLEPGECLGVIGPSGAGKSTLGRLIAGVASPTMGRVRLDGADVSTWLHGNAGSFFGYLPQAVELFEGSIKENIARLGDANPDEIIEAGKLAGLHEGILALPRGYDTEIGDAGINLSGGQLQGIGLARAFFGYPQLVLLDEPNSNLDSAGEKALHSAIERMKAAGSTIIIITHRLSILDTTDKIAILRNGILSAFGTSAEIYDRFFKPPEICQAAMPCGSQN
jgi:PrtD family type I secretion system ABC transporter